jgi:hypothetical protein
MRAMCASKNLLVEGIRMESGWHAPVFVHAEIYERHTKNTTQSTSPAYTCQFFTRRNLRTTYQKCRIDTLYQNLACQDSHKKDKDRNKTKYHERRTEKEGQMNGDQHGSSYASIHEAAK